MSEDDFQVGVFTQLSQADAERVARAYGLGAVREARGIAAGSVNSNYGLTCDAGRFFLRIYEEQDSEGAAAEARMLVALERKGVRTPAPLVPRDEVAGGESVALRVAEKPVAVFPWRPGAMRCQASVTVADATRMGAELARVHVAGEGIEIGEGRFRIGDLHERLRVIAGASDPALASQAPVLAEKLATWTGRRRSVPEGLIHGDLFRDNVLWEREDGGEIAALLDFESASRGRYVFDLMVTVLSWSFGEAFSSPVARGLCDGYRQVRELGEDERAGLHAEGCVAALRFAITRITDYAMKGGIGPRVMKDWRRFAMRFATLEKLGDVGLRQAMGVEHPGR